MKKAIHRSDNLTVSLSKNEKSILFELRFPNSYAQGTCTAACPRCGVPVAPTRWELEGPDGAGNTVWFACGKPLDGSEACDEDLTWTQRLSFTKGWEDRDN